MKTLCSLLVIFVALCVCGDVVQLTNDNFETTIKEKGKVLVEFFAPWCGHCKALAPEYEKAATALAPDFTLAKVDCTEQEELCQKHGVQGYPTLKWFSDGETTEYGGPRDAPGIEKWVRKKAAPAQVIDNKEALDGLTGDANVVVGFFNSETDEEHQEFNRLRSNPDYDEFDFAATFKANLFEVEGLEPGKPGLKLYTSHGVKRVIQGNWQDYAKEIDEYGFPLLTDIQANRFQKLHDSKKFVVVLFTGDDADKEKALVTEIAEKFRSDLGFVFGEGATYAQHASQLGISGEKFPVLVAVHEQKYFPLDESSEFTKEAITKFLTDLNEGNLKAHFKSEPEPESNDGPVTTLVGTNFEKLVLQSENDVFVEFYAPWCGHCKSLAPIWEDLGKKFKGTKVTIAKIDATANDHPVEGIQGFPTLKFFPANAKQSEPVDYTGDRTLEALTEFVKKTATTLSDNEKTEL